MSSHSEEIWESSDALWRRMQQLSRQVRELEARLAAIECAVAHSSGESFRAETNLSGELSGAILFEGEIHR
jgi:inosine/xanthosine triphosphate pyrophosphatase family protein